ncbi:metal-binding protein ZinT [Phaeobacter sp. HF9A]|uniref:ZinT family metal-binding protein n=1 Tax=Phaeobacter sp. HF9A TaxID=2721561 RepID=UPI001430190A|nr:metal-binding protein ZinT [Phaeobacter sp. HF9A]NIZ13614.1 metal-binding protein ZinT [Phaeobacter sp. HF9A]
MTYLPARTVMALATASALILTAPLSAIADHDHDHDHDHKHGETHTHAHSDQIHKGYFEDSQIQPRNLTDWQGTWQSVAPFLADGTLDPVMQHKAEHGDKSAAEYRAYYTVGYATDVSAIQIDGQTVTFTSGEGSYSGQYANDGFEVLTYQKGNRGVRYVFKKISGDAEAPAFIQFSDHRIAPEAVGHYHLYWGEDRAKVLQELTNWPTYYPAHLSGEEIAQDMLAH